MSSNPNHPFPARPDFSQTQFLPPMTRDSFPQEARGRALSERQALEGREKELRRGMKELDETFSAKADRIFYPGTNVPFSDGEFIGNWVPKEGEPGRFHVRALQKLLTLGKGMRSIFDEETRLEIEMTKDAISWGRLQEEWKEVMKQLKQLSNE